MLVSVILDSMRVIRVSVSVWVCCIMGVILALERLHVWSRILRTTPKHRKREQGRASRRCEGRTRVVRTFVKTHTFEKERERPAFVGRC